MSTPSPWADVPDSAEDTRDLEVDPHWLELQYRTELPTSYLPASTGGRQAPWRKVAAVVLLIMLVAVTATGVCLTYGPGELFDFLES